MIGDRRFRLGFVRAVGTVELRCYHARVLPVFVEGSFQFEAFPAADAGE